MPWLPCGELPVGSLSVRDCACITPSVNKGTCAFVKGKMKRVVEGNNAKMVLVLLLLGDILCMLVRNWNLDEFPCFHMVSYVWVLQGKVAAILITGSRL